MESLNYNTYICTVNDLMEEISVALILKEPEFIKLLANLDKTRYEMCEVTVINVPVYNDIEFFIKKKPDDLYTGNKQTEDN